MNTGRRIVPAMSESPTKTPQIQPPENARVFLANPNQLSWRQKSTAYLTEWWELGYVILHLIVVLASIYGFCYFLFYNPVKIIR